MFKMLKKKKKLNVYAKMLKKNKNVCFNQIYWTSSKIIQLLIIAKQLNILTKTKKKTSSPHAHSLLFSLLHKKDIWTFIIKIQEYKMSS